MGAAGCRDSWTQAPGKASWCAPWQGLWSRGQGGACPRPLVGLRLSSQKPSHSTHFWVKILTGRQRGSATSSKGSMETRPRDTATAQRLPRGLLHSVLSLSSVRVTCDAAHRPAPKGHPGCGSGPAAHPRAGSGSPRTPGCASTRQPQAGGSWGPGATWSLGSLGQLCPGPRGTSGADSPHSLPLTLCASVSSSVK